MATPILRLYDLSNNNGLINWNAVFAGPEEFDGAILKATQGTQFFDPYFEQNWKAVVAAGKVVGAYHFADMGNPQAEYAWFAQHYPTDAPVGSLAALDAEVTGATPPADFCAAWCDAFAAQLGWRALLYTYLAYAQQYLNDVRLFVNPLWLALLSSTLPATVNGWKEVTLWQNSWSAHIPGIAGNVDGDVIARDLVGLKALGKPGPVTRVSVGGGLKQQPNDTSPDAIGVNHERVFLTVGQIVLPVGTVGTYTNVKLPNSPVHGYYPTAHLVTK